MNYQECIHYLEEDVGFSSIPGLERIQYLCDLLGNPEQRLPVIHVAGTNGKGSAVAMLSSILKEAGYRVGAYTSPHLERYNERYLLNGAEISDDDFAKDVSEFDTLAEYKEDVKKKLTEKKEKEARTAKENAAVDKAIENAQMDIPEAMIETQTRQMLDDFARRMQSQGLSMEQYFQFTGQSVDKMMEDMKPQALKRIQTRLVLEKIAEVENIQPTEEEVNEEISKMAEMYKMEADKLKDLIGENEMEQMKKDMAVQKAVTLVADAAVEA